MKKKAANRIKNIAEQLGPIKKQSWEWVPIFGWELLLCGKELTQGRVIEKDKSYEIKVPVIHSYSPEKELKRQAVKSGETGIYEVVKSEHDKRMGLKKPTN